MVRIEVVNAKEFTGKEVKPVGAIKFVNVSAVKLTTNLYCFFRKIMY